MPVPRLYWTGETDMRCLAEAIGHVIDHAYAHHIERLMVLGLFCLLLGARPDEVHRWQHVYVLGRGRLGVAATIRTGRRRGRLPFTTPYWDFLARHGARF